MSDSVTTVILTSISMIATGVMVGATIGATIGATTVVITGAMIGAITGATTGASAICVVGVRGGMSVMMSTSAGGDRATSAPHRRTRCSASTMRQCATI